MNLSPEILLVDDNPADIDLFSDALAATPNGSRIQAVPDGEEAIAFLRRASPYTQAIRPSLVILDLNLPRRDGRAVLADIKTDPSLRTIPVVVFTTSRSQRDIIRSYELGANCYLSKPGSLQEYFATVQAIENFWLKFATLPQ